MLSQSIFLPPDKPDTPPLAKYRSLILGNAIVPLIQLILQYAVPEIKTLSFINYVSPSLTVIALGLTYLPSLKTEYVRYIVFIMCVITLSIYLALAFINDFRTEVSSIYVLSVITAILVDDNRLFFTLHIAFAAIAPTALIILLPETNFSKPIIICVWEIALIIFAFLYLMMLSTIEQLRDAKENLALQHQSLEDAFETLSAIICYKDLNNTIVRVNKSYSTFWNLPSANVEGKSLYDLLPYHIAQKFHQNDLEIAYSGNAQLNVIEQLDPGDGSPIRWVRVDKKPVYNASNQVIGVVIYSIDITPQVQAEERLQESEERYRLFFERAPYAALYVDSNCNILLANSAAGRVWGYTQEELMNINRRDLMPYGYEDQFPILQQQAIAEGKSFFTAEQINIRSDYRLILLECTVIIFRDKNDEPLFSVVFANDVTEQRKASEKIHNYAKLLEQSNKDLEDFAYIVSHDMREPLRNVTSHVQLLERYGKEHLNEEMREYMDFIVQNAKYMNAQITAILEYSRVGRTEPKLNRMSLHTRLLEVCDILHNQIHEQNAIVNIGEMPELESDEVLLRSLFQNLIGNAIKYRQSSVQPRIDITAARHEQYWRISVKDNGIGIAAEHFDKIFTMFGRLHRHETIEGTGIGLAICKKIIRNLNGFIEIESEEGQGSTFHVHLPA